MKFRFGKKEPEEKKIKIIKINERHYNYLIVPYEIDPVPAKIIGGFDVLEDYLRHARFIVSDILKGSEITREQRKSLEKITEERNCYLIGEKKRKNMEIVNIY